MNHKLTSEEQIIEDNLDNFKSVSDEKRSHIESIIEKTKKNKAIILGCQPLTLNC